MVMKYNLTGQRFGNWTVLRLAEKYTLGHPEWVCRCDCGTEKQVRGDSLTTGKSTNCGCQRTENLTGRAFGRLIVLRKSDKTRRGQTIWECRCDCGEVVEKVHAELVSGHVKSCGCLNHEYKDISGMKFNRWTVLERVSDSRKGIFYRCRCDCGKEKIVLGTDITREKSKSCGCYHNETASEMFSKAPGEASFNLLYNQYQHGAKQKNRSFTLSKDEFRKLTSSPCCYCGKPPSQSRWVGERNGEYMYNGVDRIDSSKGYSVENCQPCCFACNGLKSNKTEDEFLKAVKAVYEHLDLSTKNFE